MPGEHPVYAHSGAIAVKLRDTHMDEWRITIPLGAQADVDAMDDLVLLCEYKLALRDGA